MEIEKKILEPKQRLIEIRRKFLEHYSHPPNPKIIVCNKYKIGNYRNLPQLIMLNTFTTSGQYIFFKKKISISANGRIWQTRKPKNAGWLQQGKSI